MVYSIIISPSQSETSMFDSDIPYDEVYLFELLYSRGNIKFVTNTNEKNEHQLSLIVVTKVRLLD
jgi:hypothetical protein